MAFSREISRLILREVVKDESVAIVVNLMKEQVASVSGQVHWGKWKKSKLIGMDRVAYVYCIIPFICQNIYNYMICI